MPKKIVSFTLSEGSVKKIEKTSNALGMSRSELLEFLINKGFEFPDEVLENVAKISELQKETKEKMKTE